MTELLPFGTGNILGVLDPQQTSPGAFLGGMFRGPRFDLVGSGPINQIQFLFVNIGNSGAADSGGPAPMNIGCTAEVDNTAAGNQATSKKYPLTFKGKEFVRIEPRGFAWSDPINIDYSVGQFIWPRTYMALDATGLGFPSTFASSSTYGEGLDISAAQPITDKRNSGTITVSAFQNIYGPVLAVGRRFGTRIQVFGVYGDSIITGSVDGGVSGVYFTHRLGWVARGLNGRRPIVWTSRGGLSAANVRELRNTQMHLCDHVLIGLGTNDESGTAILTQTDLLRWARHFASLGCKAWVCTIPPKTTTTDAWATVENQTVTSFNTKRVTMNNWLRAGAPMDSSTGAAVAVGTGGALITGNSGHPMTGFIEIADLVESARDSGFWKAAHTSDGIHPNQTGHTAAAAVLTDLTPFT